MSTRTIWSTAIALGATSAALGADPEGATANPLSFEPVTFIAGLLAFGIAVFILHKKVWPLIVKGLQDREAKIRAEIEAAEVARAQAAASLKEYEKALAESRAETTAMFEKTKAEQSRLAAELRAKADAELSAMRERAKRDIDAARRDAVREIYAQAASLSADLAAKVLEREINAADHKRLIDDSLGALESTRA